MKLGDNSIAHLKRVVERIEDFDDDLKAINAQKSAVFKQAKKIGLDVKTVRDVVRQRRLDPTKRAVAGALFAEYFSHVEDSGDNGISPEDEGAAPVEAQEPERPPVTTVNDGPTTVIMEEDDVDALFNTDDDGDSASQQETDDGERQTRPEINMEFPDGAVPDEFAETYD